MNRYAVIVRKPDIFTTRDKYGTLVRMDYDKDTHIYSVSRNSKFLYCEESYGKSWEFGSDNLFTVSLMPTIMASIDLRFTDDQYNNMEEVSNYQIKESSTGYRCIGKKLMDVFFFDAEDDEAAKVVFVVNTDFNGKFIGDKNE